MKRKRFKSPLVEMLALLDQYGPIKPLEKTWKQWQKFSKLGNAARRRKKRQRDVARRKGRMAARRAAGLPVGEAGRRGPSGLTGWQMLVARMEPGAWYGFGDLVALLPEYGRNSVHAYVYQLMPARGVIERVHAPGGGSGVEVSALMVKARQGLASVPLCKPTKPGALKFARRAYDYSYLYRLTPLGEELRLTWR